MLQLLSLIICMKEVRGVSTKVQSGDVHTHHSHEEGCRPFYAFEPCTFTLPLDAHQLNKDIVGGAGLSEVRRGHLQFVLDHGGD